MAITRTLTTALLIVVLAGTATAQPMLRRNPPKPAEEAPSPFPPPDPKTWWTDEWPRPPEAADPLGGRRLGAAGRTVAIDNGIDAATYRLWGLMPLQTQAVDDGEMILEAWTRPSTSVRQTVTRVTVRKDGKAFVQARAGFACCEAGIARRVGFDAELPDGAAARFLALRAHAMWSAPRSVLVDEGPASTDTLCVDGTAYDLTLVLPGRAKALHRACDEAEVGQVADALEPLIAAALGHEPRYDVIFSRSADFAAARRAYEALITGGGALKPDPAARKVSPP